MSKRKKKEKRKPGRPKIELSEKQVMAAAAVGSTREEIAAILGVSSKLLQIGKTVSGTPYPEVIERGKQQGKASLRRRLWHMALNDGNAQVAIHLSKHVLGMKDSMEVTGSEGQALVPPSLTVIFVEKGNPELQAPIPAKALPASK
jgi:hypothetical protein